MLHLTPQIRWMLRTGPIRTNTTICIGKSVDRAAVLAACRALPSEQRYLPTPTSLQNSWLYSLFGTSTLQGQMTQTYRSACPAMPLPGTNAPKLWTLNPNVSQPMSAMMLQSTDSDGQVLESVCCLLVLNSVTSKPQWTRQPKPRDVIVYNRRN